jgi:hypothetical protein
VLFQRLRLDNLEEPIHKIRALLKILVPEQTKTGGIRVHRVFCTHMLLSVTDICTCVIELNSYIMIDPVMDLNFVIYNFYLACKVSSRQIL